MLRPARGSSRQGDASPEIPRRVEPCASPLSAAPRGRATETAQRPSVMNSRRFSVLLASATAGLALTLGAGCQRSAAASTASAAAPQPPEIPVIRAETQLAPDALA